MKRRNFLTAAALSAFMAFGPLPLMAQDSTYTHQTLDASTLAQYPDDPQTIQDILSSPEYQGKYVVVELAAKWCPYCARMKPEMDKAFESLIQQGADIARLTVYYQEADGSPAYETTVRVMIKGGGFPETQIWKDGQSLGYFTGARSSEEIEQILKNNFPDIVPHYSDPRPRAPGL